jgi:carboxylesterase type B
MSSYWVNFMTTGDPNGPGLPAWPQYTNMSRDRVMVLGDAVQPEAAAPAEKLAFFNAVYAKLLNTPTASN